MNDMMNKNSKYKKILNTEHMFVTLYVFNSEQNIFIYYSVRFFTYGKKLKKNFFFYPAPLFYRVRVIPNSKISGTYRYRMDNRYILNYQLSSQVNVQSECLPYVSHVPWHLNVALIQAMLSRVNLILFIHMGALLYFDRGDIIMYKNWSSQTMVE